MAQQPKDFDWLKSQLVRLLEDAMAAETPDHQACAKYADLLFKMLPRKQEKTTNAVLDQIRQAIALEKKSAAGPGKTDRASHPVEKAKDPDS